VLVTAAVFARGGSRGVPDKNLREIGGVPLVARAVAQALAVRGVERVIVSTDSEQIAEVARAAGAEVPWLRPAELATDTAREWDAWQHLLEWLDRRGELPDRLLVVPCTAPLREVRDLERCLEASMEPNTDVVLTVAPSHRNPWFNMVTVDDDGLARLVMEPPERIHRRQDAPATWDVGTVAFVVDPTYVMAATSLYDGVVRAVTVPVERSVDVDTETDLALAEVLLTRREAGRGG
jgi:N,N'-diacetyl-8-epilegionaminate cytidylyltransferase